MTQPARRRCGRYRGWSQGCACSWFLAMGSATRRASAISIRGRPRRARPPLDKVEEGAIATGRTRAVNEMAKVVGGELMGRFVIAFEVAGLLLTAALVGAIAIAHREEGDPTASRAARRSSSETSAPPNGEGSPAVLQPVGALAPDIH